MHSAATIRPYRAAIRQTILLATGHDIGTNVFVQALAKAADNLMPARPRYSESWDFDLLLRYWDSRAPNAELSDSDLLSKALSLVMGAGVMRSSDMTALQFSSIRFSEEGVRFRLSNPKNANGLTAPIGIARLTDRPTLCPVSVLEEYVSRTAAVRRPAREEVWLSNRAPYGPLATKSIARKVLKVLTAAGVDTDVFKVHSMRVASVSKALEEGELLDDVLIHGRWRSERVFRMFYERARRGVHVSRSIMAGRSFSS